MDWTLELIVVPVSDVDRAKAFYADQLGFVLDVDMTTGPEFRVVQLTPPGSECSIVLSTGIDGMVGMAAGTVRGLHLVVDGIEAARDELISRGVDVGEIDDVGGGVRYAAISDPDGNTFVLQEMSWRTGDAY
jgi:predicted enzyme related to lactoylglutathione lyase